MAPLTFPPASSILRSIPGRSFIFPSQVPAKEDFSGTLAADCATRGDGSIGNMATVANTAISDTQQTFISPTSPMLLRQILRRLHGLPSSPGKFALPDISGFETQFDFSGKR